MRRTSSARQDGEDERTRAAGDLALHQRLLDMIARAEPLRQTLLALCEGVEQGFPGVRCSVLLADDDGTALRHCAAPSIPSAVTRALDGLPIAVGSGACGTAASTGDVVIVEDTRTDPLVEAFRSVAVDHDLRSAWSQPLRAADGEVLGTFALYRDHVHRPDADEIAFVTAAAQLGALAIERDRSDRALEVAATVDELTGLPNRRVLLQQLQQRLDTTPTSVAVLFLDVDQFKLINDSLGHPAGDLVLVELADRLRSTIPQDHLIARFGGDEFVVVIGTGRRAVVDDVADRVEAAMVQPFPTPGGEYVLGASMGMAVADGDADAHSLIRDADTAMYAAKARRAGRMWFDDRLRDRLLARLSLEAALKRGISDDEFEVWYQPVIDLRTDRRAAIEALVRWTHPQRGDMVPEEFIGLAEETGLIVPLGARIVQIAVRDAAALARAGTRLRVAINVSAIQLSEGTFAADVGRALDRSGLDPSMLVLELTESVAIAHGAAPRRTLADIAAMGVRVIIDDFGTGYSSIPLLRDLPVAGLKIDRSLTMSLGEDPRMGAVIGAVTDLAHALDLFVVAEGVDTAEALDEVRARGCDYAQGFHISTPVPADQL
jgi:c-di-GMP-specific phosphodiesterase